MLKNFNMVILRYFFNLACFATAFAMSVLWLYKYLQDEDIVQFNVKAFDFKEEEYPMLSFCLYNHFIESKLKEYDENLTPEEYKKILSGISSYNGEKNINFDDVTIDLVDYFLGLTIGFRNGSKITMNQPELLQELLQVTYSGFYFEVFFKCFGFSPKFENIKWFSLSLNSSLYPNGIRPSSWTPSVTMHLPNQLLLAGNSQKGTWPKRTKKIGYAMNFELQQLDIIIRRNKRNYPCTDELNFDQIILDDYLQKVGCKTTYQRTNKSLEICDSQEKTKQANFDPYYVELAKMACRSASTLTFTYSEYDMFDPKESDRFHIALYYSSHYREIKMKIEIDLHTLIGNAGAYIGLFLGKTLDFIQF